MTQNQMQVARLVDVGRPLEIGTADVPTPGPHDVLVRVEACGLVPNTANVIAEDADPAMLPSMPAVFGLDAAGTVAAVGDLVRGLEVGQRVYVDPHLTCQTCHPCRTGRTDLCQFSSLRGYLALGERSSELIDTYPIGGLAEYLVAPDRSCAPLPDSVDTALAARFGYLGTSFAALRKGGLQAGHTLLVNGVTGTLGVAAVMIALGLGATRVLGVGRNPELIAQVQALAPGRVTVVSSEDEDDLVAWAQRETDGLGVDVFYDCLGAGGDGTSTDTLVRAVTPGGRAVLAAGGVDGQVAQGYWEILMRDVAVVGSQWFTTPEIDAMITLIGAGVIDTSALTHRPFALADVNEALAVVGDRPGGFTNIVVTPGSSAADRP